MGKVMYSAFGLAMLVPVSAGVFIVILAAGAAAVVLSPFAFFLGGLPQSIPTGLTGPPAQYWATYVAAQNQYHIPVAALLALSEMTSKFNPQYVGPDGNQGIIAMPPALFASTAAAYKLSLASPCLPTRTTSCSATTKPIDDPAVEIPVAAAALSYMKFTVASKTGYIPDNVNGAIQPFVCGAKATTCQLDSKSGVFLEDMNLIYTWLETPAGTPKFGMSGPWNQRQIGTFPLPGAMRSDPFPWGQCTWWAYYNDPVPGVRGNADQWVAEAAHAGVTIIPVSAGPAPGDVVVFGPGGGYSATYGHVAVVVKVFRRAAGALTGYEVSQANVPEGATYGTYADIPWPDSHVMAFLPPAAQWTNPLSSFQTSGD